MTPPKPPHAAPGPGTPKPASPTPQTQDPAFARLPRDESGPVFAEPWQAQAFAMAHQLSESGWFTWTEWAQALGAELKAAEVKATAAGGPPDDGSHYYEHWLAALEGLVARKGLAEPAALLRRKEDWTEAYRATPHGKPVELEAGLRQRGQPATRR